MQSLDTQIEAFVSQNNWKEVSDLLEHLPEEEVLSPRSLYLGALAYLKQEDYQKAYLYGYNAFEGDASVSNYAELLAALHVMVGLMKDAYFYRKMAMTQKTDDSLSALVPEKLIPDFTHLLETAEERPLLRSALSAHMQNKWQQAEHWYRQHLAFFPQDDEAHHALAECLIGQGRLRTALDHLRASRTVLPGNAKLAALTGRVLADLGDFAESKEILELACELDPQNSDIAAQRCKSLMRNIGAQADAQAACAQWVDQFVQDIKSPIPVAPAQERPMLSVGFIVAGVDPTRQAPALSEVLTHHDPSRFHLVGFGEGEMTDMLNMRYQSCFQTWRNVSGMEGATLRAIASAEGIDILINCAGWENTRLLSAFGSRMAPVQLSWLSSPMAPALAGFDYQIERSDHLACGSSLELRHPLKDDIHWPDDTALSFVADADLSQICGETLKCWAQILMLNPQASLLLRSHDFTSPANCQTLIERFGNYGLAHRVDVIEEADRRVFFQHGHVALLPLGGDQGPIVIDALETGRAIVACNAHDMHGFAACQVLKDLGLADDLIASNKDDYVRLAGVWINDAVKRADFHEKAANLLQTSVYFDGRARMEDLATFLNKAWAQACAQAQ